MSWRMRYLVMNAKSHKEAVSFSKQFLKKNVPAKESDYQTILATMSQDDNVAIHDESTGILDDRETIAKLNKNIKSNWFKGAEDLKEEKEVKHLLESISQGIQLSGNSYWRCEQYITKLKETSHADLNFNILEHEFSPDNFNLNGVNQVETKYDSYPQSAQYMKNIMKYVVFVSFHY
jgi:hypothetical protein